MVVTSRRGQQFAAEVRDWTLQMRDYTKIVWQESLIALVLRMQRPVSMGGRMPVRTGFLRASFRASTSPIALGTMSKVEGALGPYAWDISMVEAVIRNAKVGQTIYMGYMADYADAIEYGFGSFPGWAYQRLAVQLWPTIVSQTVARLKSA